MGGTKIRLICATERSAQDFFDAAPLGRSLRLFKFDYAELRLFDRNALGLPAVYNHAIREAEADPAILVFLHDDLHLCDFYWPEHILAGLQAFDIIGLVGNTRRVPGQCSWAHLDRHFTWDSREHLSGVIAHGDGFPPDGLDVFGPPCRRVLLLDGVFLAARSDTLIRNGIRFDEQFDFHFYDMDFCRQAESSGLSMGTWAISTVHASRGRFKDAAWEQGRQRYFRKWRQ